MIYYWKPKTEFTYFVDEIVINLDSSSMVFSRNGEIKFNYFKIEIPHLQEEPWVKL